MSTSKRQAEFDLQKWYDSENAGYDLCGEFAFCGKCNKNLENPCAVAYEAYNTKKPAVKKTACKKTTTKK